MEFFFGSFGLVLLVVMYLVVKSVRVVNEYERGVVFRLGRVSSENLKGPGLRLLVPFIDRMLKVDLRTVTHDVPAQEVITKDNVTIKVNAVVYFSVMNPIDAVLKIANHFTATSLYAQTTLRNVLGQIVGGVLVSAHPFLQAAHGRLQGTPGEPRSGSRLRGGAAQSP